MKPLPYRSRKTGEITGYQLRVFTGCKEDNGKKVVSKVWKIDKRYTPRQLEAEIMRQQFAFENEVRRALARPDVGGEAKKAGENFENFIEYWLKTISTI